MKPETQMTLFFLATLCGIALFAYESFGQSDSPVWMGPMWGIYTLVMAALAFNAWKKIKS